MISEYRIEVSLPAEFGHQDITDQVAAWVQASRVQTGVVTVHTIGSTGGITTIEYEPGSVADLRRSLEALAPVDAHYEHNARWGDGNGFSHVRSALLKTSVSIPISGGQIQLGTWQQIVAINFDNRPRGRSVIGVVIGE
jgi:secondary thiamine-phosphate synthase enzyme